LPLSGRNRRISEGRFGASDGDGRVAWPIAEKVEVAIRVLNVEQVHLSDAGA
jgi:hypothetical protein